MGGLQLIVEAWVRYCFFLPRFERRVPFEPHPPQADTGSSTSAAPCLYGKVHDVHILDRAQEVGPGGEPLPNPTHSQRYPFRENAYFTGLVALRFPRQLTR